MTMKEILSKDFDYYENRAVYFDYTHDADNIDHEFSDTYLTLSKNLIETIKNRAIQDRQEQLPKKDIIQLKEYILEEGLLEKEKLKPVLDELFQEYSFAFRYL